MRATHQRGVPRSGLPRVSRRGTNPRRVDHDARTATKRSLARWATVPAARPSRRDVLAAGTALLLAGPAALTGCAVSARAPTGPDPLESPARRAEADAALAHAVGQMAAQAHPALAATARALAEDRMTHATGLRAELHRVRPGPASPTASPAAVPPAASPVAAAPDVSAARTALVQAARAAQAEAAALVVTLPGYRAALLASIAACCSCHLALLS